MSTLISELQRQRPLQESQALQYRDEVNENVIADLKKQASILPQVGVVRKSSMLSYKATVMCFLSGRRVQK